MSVLGAAEMLFAGWWVGVAGWCLYEIVREWRNSRVEAREWQREQALIRCRTIRGPVLRIEASRDELEKAWTN